MKRYFIKIFFAVLILTEYSYSQWSTDPNNNLIVGYGLDPHICSDSAGGCYVTYDYNSTSYPRWLAVERLDKYGYKPWGINKRILGELPGQSSAQIIEDSEGGVIVSYEDRFENLPSWIANIRVQKVDSNGNFLWGQTGVKVTLDGINQGSQKIVNDGEGGAVVIWVNTLAEYKVNRISNVGERMWGDSGIVLGINGFYDPALLVRTTNNKYVASGERNTYKYLDENGNVFYSSSVVWLENIISDGYGGIVFTSRGGQFPENWQLRAQRKDSLGNSLWQEPHIVVAESLYTNTINKIIDSNGLYFFSWTGKKNGIDLIAQFQGLRQDGINLFEQGSLAISDYPLDALIGGILPSDSGNVVLVWEDFRPEDGVFGQRIDTLGNKIWNPSDVPLYTGMYADLFSTTDGLGGAIGLGWHQFDFSIRSFKVSKNGVLGEVITRIDEKLSYSIPDEIILYQNYPNPFNSSTIIQFELSQDSNLKLELYNVLGEKIETIEDRLYGKGTYSVNFSSGYLPSGIYLYKMQTETISLTKKLIIIK
jgi:hypothetical protein